MFFRWAWRSWWCACRCDFTVALGVVKRLADGQLALAAAELHEGFSLALETRGHVCLFRSLKDTLTTLKGKSLTKSLRNCPQTLRLIRNPVELSAL